MIAAASDTVVDALALADRSSNSDAPNWLTQSWTNPAWFYEGLFAHLTEHSTAALKSSFGEQYDLYHDMVTRHLGQNQVAFVWHDQARGWQSVSFDYLDQRCREQAQVWSAQGVAAGSVLCVVQPLDVAGVIALLTGIRIGACITLLPPIGDAWLQRRIAALAPDFIASAARYERLLGEFANLRLDNAEVTQNQDISATSALRSHSYASGELCANLFSPLRAPLDEATPVNL